MVNDAALSNLKTYYDALEGDAAAILKAFDDARTTRLISDEIEWIEPFGTMHGADAVIRDLFQSHTQAFSHLFFRADRIYSTRSTSACVIGRSGGTLVTGANLSGQFVHIWDFDDSTAIRMTTFAEDGTMQRSLGLDPAADMAETMGALMAAMAAMNETGEG